MRRLGLMGVVALPLLTAMLSSPSAGASGAMTRPGPPTAAQATYIAGVRGVSVSWSAPVSDGGSPILYYVASNYGGKYFCISLNPGPGACHIDGLRIGKVVRQIRVRAINANGPGQVAVILPVVTHDSNGGTSAPPPPGRARRARANLSPPLPLTPSWGPPRPAGLKAPMLQWGCRSQAPTWRTCSSWA